MNKKLLVLLMTTVSSCVLADERTVFGPQESSAINAIGTGVYTTYDTEHNYKSVAGATAWANSGDQRINRDHANYGVAVTDTLYVNPQARYFSQGVMGLIDVKTADYFAGGGLGVGTINGKAFLLGDSWAGYNFNKNISADVAFNGDVVDSVAGLQNTVTRIGGSIGTDIHTDSGTGLAFGGTSATYSNGNLQTGTYAKAYTEVAEGINVYVKTKTYTNSMPYNGDFYSPERYEVFDTKAGKKCLTIIVDCELARDINTMLTKLGATSRFGKYTCHLTLSYDYSDDPDNLPLPDFELKYQGLLVKPLDPEFIPPSKND